MCLEKYFSVLVEQQQLWRRMHLRPRTCRQILDMFVKMKMDTNDPADELLLIARALGTHVITLQKHKCIYFLAVIKEKKSRLACKNTRSL